MLAATEPWEAFAREPSKALPSYAIMDTTVINSRRSTVVPHTTVIVSKGVISAVQPVAAALPRGLRKIDGRGKYLIPGLWDAHTHLSKTGRQSLALFVANGVTGVRDMGSNLSELSSWKGLIARGQLIGPTMLISGPMIEAESNLQRMSRENGVEAFERQRVGVANPEEARAVVRRLAQAGVDQIKMRTAPDLATFAAVSQEAGTRGLPFAAHPLGRAEDLLGTGVDSLEHLLERSPAERTQDQMQALFERMAANRIHVSNTLVNIRGLLRPYDLGKAVLASPDHKADPQRRYVCGYLVRDWAEQVEENRDAPFRELLPQLTRYMQELKDLQRAGVPLLAGSDAGVMFTYPGFSMHDELELMVREAGLAPMNVLRIATAGVPAYFGRQDTLGAVEAGQVADLVLLDADPVADIRNTRRIRGVMAHGRWLDRSALDHLLAEVERDAKGDCNGGSRAGRRVTP